MLIPIESGANIRFRWYFAACFLILMNYYDAVANLIFLNLFSIAVLFGIQPQIHMEEINWLSFMFKAFDIAQFNIYFVLFAVFVTYINRLHLYIEA